jgi:hypothetical protein
MMIRLLIEPVLVGEMSAELLVLLFVGPGSLC